MWRFLQLTIYDFMKTFRSHKLYGIVAGTMLAGSAVAWGDAFADLPESYPCIYPLPQDSEPVYDNITTILPKFPPFDGSAIVYDGGIATLNGRYPAPTKGDANITNTLFHILVQDHPERIGFSYVGHFTLGANLQLSESDISVHSSARVPSRLNIFTEFLPYTNLNLSGRLLADTSVLPASGLKIYSAGATFANGLSVVGSEVEEHGKYVNVEIAGPTYVYNNFGLPIGHGMGPEVCMCCPGNTEGVAGEIHGALIYHARTDHSVENDEGKDSLYAPVTCLGDLAGGGKHLTPPDCLTNNVVFYSKWNKNADTWEAKYNLPDENTPLFISNSLKLVWSEVEVFALEKDQKADMSPMPAVYNMRYRRLSGDSHKAQMVGVLFPDGRVYSFFTFDGKPVPAPLQDAVIVKGNAKYTPDELLVLTHGSTLDMRKAGKEISLFNVTAGSVGYGGGKVLVSDEQNITMEGHKTIRHEIEGYADMDITGKAKEPINVCFERLLQPHKDHKQAVYELNNIKVNHARVYIGPGNIVEGHPHAPEAGFHCGENVELFNYGNITRNVYIGAASRVVNSHYAYTEILKHNCVCCSPWFNHYIEIPLDRYPGTIHGDVVLGYGAEFCNYGEVVGNISVAKDAVLYGCGTCGGRVSLAPGALLYFDHGLHIPPPMTGYFWQIHNDVTVKRRDDSIKYRPDGSVEDLIVEKNAALGFRISAPTIKPSATYPCPNVLTVRGSLNAEQDVIVRIDVDGSITELLPKDGSKGRVKLLQCLHPGRVRGLRNPEMQLSSGADLVEQPKLVWDSLNATLYFEAKLSRKSQDAKSRKPGTERKNRRNSKRQKSRRR